MNRSDPFGLQPGETLIRSFGDKGPVDTRFGTADVARTLKLSRDLGLSFVDPKVNKAADRIINTFAKRKIQRDIPLVGDPIESLLKAIRNGEVRGLVTKRLHPPAKDHTSPAFSDLDRWAVPTYDFAHLLDESSPEYLGREMSSAAEAGIREPHALISDAAVVINRLGMNVMIAHLTADLVCDVWVWTMGQWWADERKFSELERKPFDAALMSLWLLQHRKVVYEMAGETASRTYTNSRRQKAGLKPLEKVRVIHLTKVEKIATEPKDRAPKGGTHASPIPHDRAPQGYSYTRNGRTVVVPGPIKVKGGAAAAAPRYRVLK